MWAQRQGEGVQQRRGIGGGLDSVFSRTVFREIKESAYKISCFVEYLKLDPG